MSVFSVSVRPDLPSYEELCKSGDYSMLELNEALKRASNRRKGKGYQNERKKALTEVNSPIPF